MFSCLKHDKYFFYLFFITYDSIRKRYSVSKSVVADNLEARQQCANGFIENQYAFVKNGLFFRSLYIRCLVAGCIKKPTTDIHTISNAELLAHVEESLHLPSSRTGRKRYF